MTPEVCKDFQTDKCPLGVDGRVTALEGWREDMDKDYAAFKTEVAASQARTQGYVEKIAEAEAKRGEADIKRDEREAEEAAKAAAFQRQLILRLITYGGVILLALLGLKAMVPGFLG